MVERTLARNHKEFEHPVTAPRKAHVRWKFNAFETIAVVKRLKATAPGEDGIQNAIIKRAPPIFWELATAIYNASMTFSYIPTKWKCAVVAMIPKEGKDWQTLKG